MQLQFDISAYAHKNKSGTKFKVPDVLLTVCVRKCGLNKLCHNCFCVRFDQGKSTKGASKLRRDLINAEIANLRDLLPLPPSTRQRLSQLQLMALVCVYVRKSNYFQQGQ
jgi:hypothetical protein